MTEKHEYTDENGLKWTRVFEVVNVGFDTSPNIFSSTSFADSTSNKKETIGDIQSRAMEASEKGKINLDTILCKKNGLIVTRNKGMAESTQMIRVLNFS